MVAGGSEGEVWACTGGASSWGSSKSGMGVEDVWVDEELVLTGGLGACKSLVNMCEGSVGAPAAVTALGREADASWVGLR